MVQVLHSHFYNKKPAGNLENVNHLSDSDWFLLILIDFEVIQTFYVRVTLTFLGFGQCNGHRSHPGFEHDQSFGNNNRKEVNCILNADGRSYSDSNLKDNP